MKIDSDKLIINNADVDAVNGAKPEPEERPIIREMSTGVRVGVNSGPGVASRDAALGTMHATVNSESTAGEFFKRATPCSGCVHFRVDKWLDMLKRWKEAGKSDPVQASELDRVRALFVSKDSIDALVNSGADPDSLISNLGVCTAYTRFYLDHGVAPVDASTIVHPLSACPDRDANPKSPLHGKPLPKLYKENRNAMINKIRDDLLLRASKK